MEPTLIETELNAAVAANHFSGVISVRRHGVALYERAAGYADRSNGIKNTLDTRFGTASGTKFFTALAIGKLIAAGKLSFETKLTECLHLNFPHYSPDITIRHLLTHTSGIPDYLDEEEITDFDNVRLATPYYDLAGPRDYLAIFPDAPMKFLPGTHFSYSNGGYILLGVVIEELTGVRYQEFVERELFQTHGMTRSGFFAFNRLPDQTAFGYIEEESGWRTNIYNLPIVGASDGGAYTTLQDLETLWQAFWDGDILPPELAERYARPYIRAEGEGEHTYSGHGLWLSEEPGHPAEAFITGSDAGVSFKSSVRRAENLSFTVMSNTSDGAWNILRELKRILG